MLTTLNHSKRSNTTVVVVATSSACVFSKIPTLFFGRFCASDQAEFDDTEIEASQHQKHGVCAPNGRKSRFHQSNDTLQIQTALDHSLPKRSNDVGPIFPLYIRSSLSFQKVNVVLNRTPLWKIVCSVDASQNAFFLLRKVGFTFFQVSMAPSDNQDSPTRSCYSKEFVDKLCFVRHVFSTFQTPDQIERVVFERLVESIRDLKGSLIGHSLLFREFISTCGLVWTQGNALSPAVEFASNVTTASTNAAPNIHNRGRFRYTGPFQYFIDQIDLGLNVIGTVFRNIVAVVHVLAPYVFPKL
mmetsp:Transcript_33781/g.79629  ORF Transcript_33781/g.79629 Transcript_33781/m.79629 type:complete len:300 (-) Transcript_33781:387-1286(-)